MELHKKYDFLNISWLPTEKSVLMTWTKFATGNDFRSGLDEGLNLLQQRRSSNWLADLRDLGTVPQEDQTWSNENWYPRAVAAGIRKMAIIMPKSIISTMSVKSILMEMNNVEIETNYFDNVDEAKAWLN